ERRHAVGVDVLGRPFELGERGDLLAAGVGQRVVDLQPQRLVGLDDERTVGQGESPRRDSATGGRFRTGPVRARYPRGGAAEPVPGGTTGPNFLRRRVIASPGGRRTPGDRGRPPGGERRRDGAATTGGDDQ